MYLFPSNSKYVSKLFLPFMNEPLFDIGWVSVVFGTIVIVGSSNAVNLTDGLDGLAILPTVMVGGA